MQLYIHTHMLNTKLFFNIIFDIHNLLILLHCNYNTIISTRPERILVLKHGINSTLSSS